MYPLGLRPRPRCSIKDWVISTAVRKIKAHSEALIPPKGGVMGRRALALQKSCGARLQKLQSLMHFRAPERRRCSWVQQKASAFLGTSSDVTKIQERNSDEELRFRGQKIE